MTSTTPPHFFPWRSQAKPRSPIVAFGKFNDEQGLRIAPQKRGERRFEDRNFGREPDHGSIHEFDRDGFQSDDMLRRVHRLEERTEVADADGPAPEQRRKLQFDRRRKRQRSLRTHQKMREIDAAVGLRAWRRQGVEIVSADASLDGGKSGGHFGGFARADPQEVLE
jgi:hypothetical protein